MSIRMILAVSVALIAGPAFAQDAAAPPPSAEQAADPAEAAIEAKAEVFQQRMEAMGAELQTAIAAGAPAADLDAITARYQPEADAFSAELQAFFDAKIAASTNAEEKAGLAAGAAQAVPMVKGVPAMVRGQVQAAAAATPVPAAPQ